MKKTLLSAVAALAFVGAPAYAADMPAKAAPLAPVAAPIRSTCCSEPRSLPTTNCAAYRSPRTSPAVQGYFELDYTATDWLKLYAGLWGSSLYSGLADAEFDLSGGARFTFGNFGLDVGFVYYDIPTAR